jgi:hypothetical protein
MAVSRRGVVQAVLLCSILSTPVLAGRALAETKVVRDGQGRVILEIKDDGTRIVHSYGPDGREIEVRTPPPSGTGDAKH